MPLEFDRDSYSFVKKKKAGPSTPAVNTSLPPPPLPTLPKPALRMMPVPAFLQHKAKIDNINEENKITN
jgi:hypothetical protein